MGEYNKVIMLGNLTRDPDLRYTPTGMPVCEFPLAVHHRYSLNDELKEEACLSILSHLAKSPSAARAFCKTALKCS
jgi:single-stranded DNA-binding protein